MTGPFVNLKLDSRASRPRLQGGPYGTELQRRGITMAKGSDIGVIFFVF